MKLWVNVCFYYAEERLEKFYKLIGNLSNIPDIKLIINSNVNFDSNLTIHTSSPSDPYWYTWEHKKYMPEFLESDYTHFAYLEGNIDVQPKIFDYWLETRELFKRNNLNFLPAIHRVQKANGQTFSLDCVDHQGHRPIISVENRKFISLSYPYQGMFIMDRELVEEHINSEYFSFGLKKWFAIRESANLGNMFINVPNGFEHRYMTPLDNFSDTWITHFGTDYHNDMNTRHAKINMEHLFQ